MKVFTCQNIAHEGEPIQGFCLNLGCQDSRPQFCLQCEFDSKKHSNCKKDLKRFGQIQSYITKFNQNILDLATQLNKSFAQVKIKYEEFSKYMENKKTQLIMLSECLSQQDYQQMKVNVSVIKEWYQYLNNQEEIMKQNQIGTQLVRIKKMIQALGQQQILDIKQDNENALSQGIQLLNQQKWQEANEKITQSIKISEKQLSLATLFKSICLIEMNQPGLGIIMRDQAKKMNNNLYRDLLDYSDQELRKNIYIHHQQNIKILIQNNLITFHFSQFSCCYHVFSSSILSSIQSLFLYPQTESYSSITSYFLNFFYSIPFLVQFSLFLLFQFKKVFFDDSDIL
ncbi:unnamed protein product [Paramecium octaurelia]|uniref:Uncharacterized protein n=1 Tax=Paramecium octaurelia TaxID=43137 RepID=A0A8S1TSZ8_PAROT|nr:unnamed protein product [Paramecium octaurelia]